MKIATALKKVTPLFPSNPTLKVEVLSSPPLIKIWLEAQSPPPCRKRGGGGGMEVGAHYDDIKIGDECFNIKINAATCRTYTHAVQLVKGPVSPRCGHGMF